MIRALALFARILGRAEQDFVLTIAIEVDPQQLSDFDDRFGDAFADREIALT